MHLPISNMQQTTKEIINVIIQSKAFVSTEKVIPIVKAMKKSTRADSPKTSYQRSFGKLCLKVKKSKQNFKTLHTTKFTLTISSIRR